MFQLLLIILVVLAVCFFVVFISALWRNKKLEEWACSVNLTKEQQDAMWELWTAFKEGRTPKVDPLARLSKRGREHIKTICSAEYRPEKFGSADTLRLAKFIKDLERGYTPAQAAVLAGMTFNRVGRKDILHK